MRHCPDPCSATQREQKAKLRAEYIGFGGSEKQAMSSNGFLNIILSASRTAACARAATVRAHTASLGFARSRAGVRAGVQAGGHLPRVKQRRRRYILLRRDAELLPHAAGERGQRASCFCVRSRQRRLLAARVLFTGARRISHINTSCARVPRACTMRTPCAASPQPAQQLPAQRALLRLRGRGALDAVEDVQRDDVILRAQAPTALAAAAHTELTRQLHARNAPSLATPPPRRA